MTTAMMETSKGKIVLELFVDDCPVTTGNFIKLANDGFYDGLTFHRVIDNFMVQGGCPNSRPGESGMAGTGDAGYKFDDEASALAKKHDKPGMLSMANAGPNTNGSQFFITHVVTDWLDGKHGVFGQVVEGMDVVNTIAQDDELTKVTISEG